jgi:RND superfamily putative drug exporter
MFSVGVLDCVSPSISGGKAEVSWTLPLMMTTTIVGLSSDDDIFMFAGITELRAEGLLMVIAFRGLAPSGMPTMRQVGVFLAASVLLDTLVVRPLMVPPILHLLGRFNCWPNGLSRTTVA